MVQTSGLCYRVDISRGHLQQANSTVKFHAAVYSWREAWHRRVSRALARNASHRMVTHKVEVRSHALHVVVYCEVLMGAFDYEALYAVDPILGTWWFIASALFSALLSGGRFGDQEHNRAQRAGPTDTVVHVRRRAREV